MLTRPFDIIVSFISCGVYASETIHRPLSERFPFVWQNRLFRWKIRWYGPFYLLKFFRKKEYLQKYSFFLGFIGIQWIGISLYHLRGHTCGLVPCSLINWRQRWMGNYAICVWWSTVSYLAENFHRFSLQMESAPPVRFCLWKNCTVPSGRKFSPVFSKIETANSFKKIKLYNAVCRSSWGSPAVWTGKIQPSWAVFDICLE